MALKIFGRVQSFVLTRVYHVYSAEKQCLLPVQTVCCRNYASSNCERTKNLNLLCAQSQSHNLGGSFLSHFSCWNRKLIFTRHMSGVVISRFTKDIDLDKLREEVKQESRETGQPIQLVDRVRQLVAQRCAEAIANLDEDGRKKLRVLQLEHNFLYSEGHDIPVCIVQDKS